MPGLTFVLSDFLDPAGEALPLEHLRSTKGTKSTCCSWPRPADREPPWRGRAGAASTRRRIRDAPGEPRRCVRPASISEAYDALLLPISSGTPRASGRHSTCTSPPSRRSSSALFRRVAGDAPRRDQHAGARAGIAPWACSTWHSAQLLGTLSRRLRASWSRCTSTTGRAAGCSCRRCASGRSGPLPRRSAAPQADPASAVPAAAAERAGAPAAARHRGPAARTPFRTPRRVVA